MTQCLQNNRRLQVHDTGRTLELIDQYWCGMRSIGCSSTALATQAASDLYGAVFVSSLRLPPSVHVNLPWGNLSPVSLSMQRSATQAASFLRFYGFVFVVLSYSSYFSYSPSFLFCSHASFHLECTSNSLGATSLWPAGLPKAIKQGNTSAWFGLFRFFLVSKKTQACAFADIVTPSGAVGAAWQKTKIYQLPWQNLQSL